MKKEYTKPLIVFDSFTLSTNIAANCDRHVSTMTQGICGVAGSFPGLYLFVSGVGGCSIRDPDGITDDGYCYHVPDVNRQLFHS